MLEASWPFSVTCGGAGPLGLEVRPEAKGFTENDPSQESFGQNASRAGRVKSFTEEQTGPREVSHLSSTPQSPWVGS